ncbi:sec-independent translocase (plasmid) [Streptomyces sp. HUAS TT11]|uniref:sec-independent translocase n=1 Tax=Streptomyces sp. HUAS TT11 TaxID=3447508 RepID=UPI003F65CB2C
MFSDVGPLELVTLAVLAILLFGPDKLPEIIQNVTGFLRRVRDFSESTKQEIRSELGPAFKDFEFEDLHPKVFVRKHVLDGESLGLADVQGALDPRAELAQVAETVREAVDEAPRETAAQPVSLTKDTQTRSPSRATFDPDAT